MSYVVFAGILRPMKQTKTYSEYAGSAEELLAYYHRFNKMPDLGNPEWANTPELLTPENLKGRKQRLAAHLKLAIPLGRLIHWADPEVSLGLAQYLGWKIRRSQTHQS